VSRWKPTPTRPILDPETPEQRAERVEQLRRSYVSGTLDMTVPVDSDGVDRLLEDLFNTDERRRRTRR
jgi:hypothetical protein